MANYLTYNNTVALLQNMATAHYQINQFGYGDPSEIDTEKQIMYPLFWVIPIETTIGENTIKHTFDFIVADLVDKDEANELEVLSDSQSILADFVKAFRMGGDDFSYNLVGEPVLTPFTEFLQDDDSGHQMRVTLEFDFNNSQCNLPMDAFTLPGPTFAGTAYVSPSLSVEQLSDTTITNPINGQVLMYQNGIWINGTVSSTDYYVTGGTFNSGTITLTRNDGGTVEVSGISSTDYYVTGGTFNTGTITLTRNDGGQVAISGISSSDYYVTGGTYSNGITTLVRNDGNTVIITGYQTPPSTSALTITSTTDINGVNLNNINYTGTTNLSAITFTYSNIVDGAQVDLDLLKTVSGSTLLTYPSGTIVSYSSAANVTGNTATIISTSSGRFNITHKRYGNIYKVWISQDVL